MHGVRPLGLQIQLDAVLLGKGQQRLHIAIAEGFQMAHDECDTVGRVHTIGIRLSVFPDSHFNLGKCQTPLKPVK